MEKLRKILGRDMMPDDEIPPELRERSFTPEVPRRPSEPSVRRVSRAKVNRNESQPLAQIINSSPNALLVRPQQAKAPPERVRSPKGRNSLHHEGRLEIVHLNDALSHSYKVPAETVPSGLSMEIPCQEEAPEGAQSFAKMRIEENEVITQEARPQGKSAQEELPDLINKFKVKEEEIENLGRSLEILYKRRNLEKAKFQDMVDNLERDNVQMEDAIRELRHLRKRTDSESVHLQRLTVNMRRESNEVANAMAKLQEDNNHLSLKEAALTDQVHDLVSLKKNWRIEIEELAKECKGLGLENATLVKTLENEVSKNALKEHKYREEMEEKYIRQRIEHEELKATIKERDEEISRKDSIYQELLQKNKAQKKIIDIVVLQDEAQKGRVCLVFSQITRMQSSSLLNVYSNCLKRQRSTDPSSHLIDHSVYLDNRARTPEDWEEINERLAIPEPSLAPSKFSEIAFKPFRQRTFGAATKPPGFGSQNHHI